MPSRRLDVLLGTFDVLVEPASRPEAEFSGVDPGEKT
jgi:hypothetical protein